ncbi:peptide chain release factor N(5)-glutamine methyltransferase [Alloscardovia criceti]|uniref:peptide chain release factor N(5)-glutamine methyltransferase n=1 Tax=Alloscardovia criceti TaxID=356828 RepID=UPI00039CB64C|nr:peptide chain release factor N(5)-glutamine methyltransferase [Alloscardovia criceti]
MRELTPDMRVRTVLSQCAHALLEAGVGSEADQAADRKKIAEHEVMYLLAEACGASMSALRGAVLVDKSLGQIADATHIHRFQQWMERRLRREPLQYIVGHAPFRFLEVEVGEGVFIPRPETELLIDAALEYAAELKNQKPRIVDLCAGSGVLGLSAATEIPHSTVWAVELSPQAFTYAQKNAHTLDATNYSVMCADATDKQTLSELDGTVDIVLSNPPYVPLRDVPEQIETRDYDPELALYGASEDGMRIPELILRRAYDLLTPGGLLLMEHDWQQGAATREVADRLGYSHYATKCDFSLKDRYLSALK